MRNPCIASIFMNNIDKKTVESQATVTRKFNKSNVAHYHVLTDEQPGTSLDKLVTMLEGNGHDAIMFLDIDCIPLNEDAIDYMFEKAYAGILIGDAQRSNHIQNDQHVFCAPHNVCFSIETYNKLGNPTFNPTPRGDVAEELTYKARESNIPLEILMPIRYDAPPIRMAWEKDTEPFWRLADGMPNYGVGTTFGTEDKELFWHNYQIFHQGQQKRFWDKCASILNA